MVESIAMEENMKNYLSIGEVSKLKGVSVKSLRYYGELGILIPAYINKETGYRYYSMEQMVIVDLIITCLDFDIPLKNFNNYIMKDGFINTEKILNDGKKIANQKILNIRKSFKLLENISNHLSITTKIKTYEGVYNRNFSKRFLLTEEWSGNIYDIRLFMEKITKLYNDSEKYGLTPLYNQGVLFLYKNNKVKDMVFLEVDKFCDITNNMLILPDVEFVCEVFTNDELLIAENKYLKDKMHPDGSVILIRELYDKKIDNQPTPVEVQFYLKKQENHQ
ncbi:MerR family DNA-binding transcriptional regulator [Sedimentibacter sp. zth1]|uniref:MerR family DNA-binding transcriptional regulator n=1 Tax=Sedimentibacter sp. zth1 TaxID=2816908 RepID=UPI001A928C95|nr:MerR family DNA-binding transcriptional regulator [Sedimentibacter sp. zth1]QSX06264.1 MerR family DNA-binding transcriptional regulator [Sedimentibacter sp. zth1]